MNQPSSKPETRLIKLALRYIAIRSRSRAELTTYLKFKNRGQNPGIVTGALASIERFNVLNDCRFATDYARYLLNRGKGPILIKYQLKLKGIDHDLINQTIIDLEAEEIYQSASKQLTKISQSWQLTDPRLFKPKAYHYLRLRGFPPSIIDRVIDETTPGTVE